MVLHKLWSAAEPQSKHAMRQHFATAVQAWESLIPAAGWQLHIGHPLLTAPECRAERDNTDIRPSIVGI